MAKSPWCDLVREEYRKQEKKDLVALAELVYNRFNVRLTCKQVKGIVYKDKNYKNTTTLPDKESDSTTSPSKGESLEMRSDGTQVSEKLLKINDEQLKNPLYMLEAHGYDPLEWELVNCRNNLWNAYSKLDGVQTLYSSKISVRPKVQTVTIDQLIERFTSSVSHMHRPEIPTMIKSSKAKYLLEIPIMDLHLSKFSWSKETGDNYSHKIAEQRMLGAIGNIISRVDESEIERIVLPLGNDFFNFDNPTGTTSNGTAQSQSSDSRWQKMFLDGCDLMVKVIDVLSRVAPVDVLYVPGNHDRATSYYLVNYLFAWFRGNENVCVSIDPKTRKYYEYGVNLIGYTHSDAERRNLTNIMQVEAREQWGRTYNHEWHVGHLHKERKIRDRYIDVDDEDGGVIIRNIPSMCGSDSWHVEAGFVGSVKKAQSFIWHKEHGLMCILNTPITAIDREGSDCHS